MYVCMLIETAPYMAIFQVPWTGGVCEIYIGILFTSPPKKNLNRNCTVYVNVSPHGSLFLSFHLFG